MSSLPHRWIGLMALTLLLGSTGAFAQKDPGFTIGGQPARIEKDSAAARVINTVYDGRYGYVRIETREPGAALNQHPVAIDPGALRALLVRARLPGRGDEPVLTELQLDEIVAPLAKALALATPEQDVSFAVSGQHGYFGPLSGRSVTTARVFFADSRMNLIFGLVRQDWENQYRATGYVRPFEPGKRTAIIDRSLKLATDSAASLKRSDWLVLDPAAPMPAPPATAAPPAPPPAVVIPAPATAPSPVPAPAAAPSATSPAAGGSAPAIDGDAIYRQASERLRALQKLRETGVITEQEYQDKRREILKAL